jgi:hypothetical protein
VTRYFASSLAALAAALLLVPAAHGAQITGDPLLISADDTSGRLGVAFAGSQSGEFFLSSVNPETRQVSPANAGFNVVILEDGGGATVVGHRAGGLTPTGANTVSGSGTAQDPFRLLGTWTYNGASGPLLELRQELIYVNGQEEFRARNSVRNLSTQGLTFRASTGADLYGGGSDSGIGLFEAGPPRFVAGFNTSVGSVAGLAEVTPWSHFEEGPYSSVLGRADSAPASGSLLDRVEPTEVDNGAAVQWDNHAGNTPLGPGQTAAFEVIWRFTRTFSIKPELAEATTGDEVPFEVELRDTQGRPGANQAIRWSTAGANNIAGQVRTDANGRASFVYVGGNPGTDQVTAYWDRNGNGQRDPDEPAREATVNWTGLPAPTFAREVNLAPVSGVVRYRLPRRGRGKVTAAGSRRFRRLTDAVQVPVGAELDATRGRVQLTSTRGARSFNVQSLQAYRGRFTVRQPRRGRGRTDLRMTGQLRCVSGRSGGLRTSARRRSRRLWARGRGRFRVRGRRSAATVRGTRWFTKDTCSSTTTVVREGVVVVRDFARRKNIRVKAGSRYVARARRR